MLRLFVVLVSIFVLSKVAFATSSDRSPAETLSVAEVNQDAPVIEDESIVDKSINKEGEESQK